MLGFRFSCLVLAAGVVGIAQAQVTKFNMLRSTYYDQASDSVPTANLRAFEILLLGSPGDLQKATVTTPSGTNYSKLGSLDGSSFDFSAYPGSEAAAISSFPSGNYTVSVTKGNLTGKSDSINFPNYATQTFVPQILGDGFSRLNSTPGSQSITLDLSAPSNFNSAGPDSGFDFSILDITAGWTTVFSTTAINPSSPSITIPANTLTSNHQYQFDYEVSLVQTNSLSFGGSPVTDSFSGSAWTTLGQFTSPVPEPSSFAAIALGALALLRRRRR